MPNRNTYDLLLLLAAAVRVGARRRRRRGGGNAFDVSGSLRLGDGHGSSQLTPRSRGMRMAVEEAHHGGFGWVGSGVQLSWFVQGVGG